MNYEFNIRCDCLWPFGNGPGNVSKICTTFIYESFMAKMTGWTGLEEQAVLFSVHDRIRFDM